MLDHSTLKQPRLKVGCSILPVIDYLLMCLTSMCQKLQGILLNLLRGLKAIMQGTNSLFGNCKINLLEKVCNTQKVDF